jgi:hypothetical protein
VGVKGEAGEAHNPGAGGAWPVVHEPMHRPPCIAIRNPQWPDGYRGGDAGAPGPAQGGTTRTGGFESDRPGMFSDALRRRGATPAGKVLAVVLFLASSPHAARRSPSGP